MAVVMMSREWTRENPVMETSYVGRVLATYEINGRDDSDFVALVWADGELKRVAYASTRGWTYPNFAEVDATPEVIAEAKAHFLPQVKKALRERAEKAAKRVFLHDEVVNARGLKIKRGTTGRVVWMGRDRFSGEPRIGVETADGLVYGPLKNWDPVAWRSRVMADADIAELARSEVERLDVRSLIYYRA